MRWSAYLALTSTVIFPNLIHAAMPVSVPGEFSFPGNTNPLIYPAGLISAGARKQYAESLVAEVNADASLSADEKAKAVLRIRYSEADSQSLFPIVPTQDLGISCTQAQYDEGAAVFKESIYLANYARTRVVATDDIFRQLFTDLLPKFKSAPQGAATPEHVRAVFEAIYALNPFFDRPDDAIVVAPTADGVINQATNNKWIKLACPKECTGFGEIAYVPVNSNLVNLCPKFFTMNNLKTIPRTEAAAKELCESNSGTGLFGGTLHSSGVATILHELQHSRYMSDRQPTLFSDDHGYGISFWSSIGVKLISMGKYKGSIVDLTPAQAKVNADTYAWYALLLVRRDLCKIAKIDVFDKMSCFRKFALKLGRKGAVAGSSTAPASVNDHLEGEDPIPNAPPECAADCGPTGAGGKVKRSLDGRAAICCLAGTKSAETKNPKTGKTTMTCVPDTCPAGQIATKKKDPKTLKMTTTCACPAGQTATQKKDPKTLKMVTTCACPAGQTATQKKDPKTGKMTTTCGKGAATICPAGSVRVQKKDAKTGKVSSICAPAPKTPAPKPPAPKPPAPKPPAPKPPAPKPPAPKTPPKKVTPPKAPAPKKKAGPRRRQILRGL